MIEMFLKMDADLLLWIQHTFQSDALTPVVRAVTHLGDKGMIWIVLALIFCIPKSTRKTGIAALLALLFSLIINNMILKNLVARTRPYEVISALQRLIEIQKDFSFPSGHSGSSFAAATAMFLTLPRKQGVPILVLAALIAFSRLYLDVHYPTDVLSGILIGILCAVLGVKLTDLWEKRKEKQTEG